MLNATVILANGDFPQRGGEAWKLLAEARRVVCCDGAARAYRRRFKKNPTVVVGDMDSFNVIKGLTCPVVREAEQETNDLAKAIRFCRAHRWGRLVIVGATGKREDHTLGNLFRALDERLPVVTDYGRFEVVEGTRRFRVHPNAAVSVFAPYPRTHMTSRGLNWPLKGVRFDTLYRGTLNHARTGVFSVTSDRPALIYIAY